MKASDFKEGLVVAPCVKTCVPPLIGLYGESGGGKTVTGLVALIGMTQAGVKVGGIDTENRRMGMAADVAAKLAAARYGAAPEIVVVNLEPPFHPLRYVAAMELLLEQGCGAIIIDSMSHAWGGEGGYLDLKEEEIERMTQGDPRRRDKVAMAAAAHLKPFTHAKLIRAVLQIKVPTVLCFRSKDKVRMGKDESGRMQISVDQHASPIQESGLSYDMLLSGEVFQGQGGQGGFCEWIGPNRKHTHPELLKLLPASGVQFSFEHGEGIAAWIGAKTAPSAPRPAAASPAAAKPGAFKAPETVRAKWVLALTKAGGGSTSYALEYAIGEGILTDTQALEDWPIEKIPTTPEAAAAILNEIKARAGVV